MWIAKDNGIGLINTDNVKSFELVRSGEKFSIGAGFGKGDYAVIATYDDYDEAVAELFAIAEDLNARYLKGSFIKMGIPAKRFEERKKNEHRKDK